MAVNVRPDVSRTRTAPTPATGWTRPGNWYDWWDEPDLERRKSYHYRANDLYQQYGGYRGRSESEAAMNTWWENEFRRLQAEANAPAREAAEAAWRAQREADMSQPAREPVLMPDYARSYMPMAPPPAPGVIDPNMPGPPDPNVPDQNAPDPGLNLTPAYQSLGMDAAFMGPAKPRPQRRGGVYTLVLGAR